MRSSPPRSSAPRSCSSTPTSPGRSSSTCSSASGPRRSIYDSEFENLLEGAEGEDPELTRIISWVDDGYEGDRQVAEDAIAHNSEAPLDPPDEPSRFVILTSGTTGTPKGAQRGSPDSLAPLAILLSKIPLRAERKTVIAAPLFHSWGFLNFAFGLALGSTLVLRRRFDPEATLADGRRQRCRRARRRAGDAAADPRAADQEITRPLRPAEPADHGGERLGAARASWRPAGWTASATTSTTSTARPRSAGRRSRPPRTCARRPAPPAGRRTGPR